MSESRKMRIPLREWRSKTWEKERENRLEKLASEQRDTTTIAGKFAKALGCLEDALCWLEQVNAEYDPEEHADDIRLVTQYGLPPCNPAMDFWLQTELAENAVKDRLRRLRQVAPPKPKELAKV